jgi:hypothetical protein
LNLIQSQVNGISYPFFSQLELPYIWPSRQKSCTLHKKAETNKFITSLYCKHACASQVTSIHVH